MVCEEEGEWIYWTKDDGDGGRPQGEFMDVVKEHMSGWCVRGGCWDRRRRRQVICCGEP